MCWRNKPKPPDAKQVSVAGCLGYDVLVTLMPFSLIVHEVSVAGCLGYDVLGPLGFPFGTLLQFQLLVV